MVDLSNVGRNIGAENVAAAIGGTTQVDKLKKKERKKTPKGLGLEDIPEETPYVSVEETGATEELEDAGNILDMIDSELEDIQDKIKNYIAKKIQLADKHENKRHELLTSAFNDCKNAYTKIKEVRNNINA